MDKTNQAFPAVADAGRTDAGAREHMLSDAVDALMRHSPKNGPEINHAGR